MNDLIDISGASGLSALVYRLKHGGGHKKQAIARAVGTSSKYRLKVIDATCGFGSDAIVLANLNCKVYAIEKNITIASLLKDRLLIAQENALLRQAIKNIKFFTGNALTVIPEIIKQYHFTPDVIYLDPMFASKSKAAPNKIIQSLRKIIDQQPEQLELDSNNSNNNLLSFCLKYCKKRVVVKRSKSSPYLENLKPNFSLTGKANRFDVYILAAL